MSDNRFEDALNQINEMNFYTGRADLLGMRVREVIRRAFHPNDPCPKCRGAGEIPQTRTPDCGDCVNYTGTGPWSGDCGKGHKIQDETDSICRSDFEHRLPMEVCPSCGGKKEKVVIANEES